MSERIDDRLGRRGFLAGAAGFGVATLAAGCSGKAGSVALPLAADEQRRLIAGMKPPKRARPLVAIVADNRGAETTDLMIPQAVLTRSGLVDVTVIAPTDATIAMMPALSIEPQDTLAGFDKAHPDGADYVIVPAYHHDDREGPIVAWIRQQAASRATIIGICEGAKVLGRAGLLDGRMATTHWYAIDGLMRAHPAMRYARDRRYVVDRGVVTTTGVTASIPVSLALVEAIGGKEHAEKLAAQLGVSGYDAAHDSRDFHLNAGWVWQLVSNSAAVWGHETIGIPVADGVDGIALALTADAWSRTYRSKALALTSQATVLTADGLKLTTGGRSARETDLTRSLDPAIPPASQLDRALEAIAARYGRGTAGFVALQLEFPWRLRRRQVGSAHDCRRQA